MGMMGYKDCETCQGLGKIKCDSQDSATTITPIIESQIIPEKKEEQIEMFAESIPVELPKEIITPKKNIKLKKRIKK
jgi:hypothetical protein